MIKIFTLNKNGKIELTKKELKQILNESYWEGYRNSYSNSVWTYHSPSITSPYITCTSATNSVTVKSNSITTELGESNK